MERQYADLASLRPGVTLESLRVNSSSVDAYLRKFEWDYARYHHSGRPMNEIVAQIQGMASKIDEELKKLTTSYSDKTLQLSTLLRKKNVNMTTSDFEDFLTPEAVSRLEILQADGEKILETVMVVVPKALEQGNHINVV